MNKDKVYINKVIELFKLISEGVENIKCPNCGSENARIFYTKSRKDRYGIWVRCEDCKNIEHADTKISPVGFDEKKINKRFQDMDDHAWRKADELVRRKNKN